MKKKDITSCKLLSGVARTLVKDIPSYLGGGDVACSDDSLFKVIEVMPESGRDIRFIDDVWDFSEFFKLMVSSGHVLDFRVVPPELKDAFKDYAALLIDRIKIRTVHQRIESVNRALTLALAVSDEHDPRLLTAGDISRGMADLGPLNQKMLLDATILFFRMMSHLGYPHSVNVNKLKEFYVTIADQSKYTKHEHFGNIPEPYFNILIRTFDRIMRDESQLFNDRIAAGVLLVNSQLGLRCSETVLLRTDCVHWRVCVDGVRRPYIVYQSLKAARGRNEAVDVETICTPIALETINYLVELRARGPYAKCNDFLFRLDEPNVRGKEDRPHLSTRLNDFNKRLVRFHVPEATLPWKGLRRRTISHCKTLYTIPSIHNYRVHFAVSLYEQGVSLPYIESMMSHSVNCAPVDSYYSSVVPSAQKREAILEISSHPMADELDNYLQALIDDDDDEKR